MKIFICSGIFLFQISVARAQTFNPGLPVTAPPAAPAAPTSTGPTNANGAAGNSQGLALAEAGVSAGMGVALLIYGHGQIAAGTEMVLFATNDCLGPGCAPLIAEGQRQIATGTMEMSLGGSLVEAGVQNALQGQGYGNTGGQIAAGDPGMGNGSDTGTGSPGGPDPYLPGLLNTANQIAAQSGTTVPALASQADSGGGGGGGMGSFASSLPQDAKDAMAKAAADAKAHYKVSSVAFEDLGGGKQKDDSAFDLNGILNGLKDRGPASIAGLQKSLNGEPIGVAQDNIFKQISRKYQAKIALRMFLPIQK